MLSSKSETNHDVKPIIEPKKVEVKSQSYFKYDDDTRKFFVLDEMRNDLGYFTHKQIIKLISKQFDKFNQFLPGVEVPELSAMLIKNQILEIDHRNVVSVKTLGQSNFIKDISGVIQMNNLLREFKHKEMAEELAKVGNQRARAKLEHQIMKFIHYFLLRSLEVLSIFSEKIKDSQNEDLKKKLNKYTVSAVYEYSQFVQRQVNLLMEQNVKMADALNKLDDSRVVLGNKIDKIAAKIHKQNEILREIGSNVSNIKSESEDKSIVDQIAGYYDKSESIKSEISVKSFNKKSNNKSSIKESTKEISNKYEEKSESELEIEKSEKKKDSQYTNHVF